MVRSSALLGVLLLMLGGLLAGCSDSDATQFSVSWASDGSDTEAAVVYDKARVAGMTFDARNPHSEEDIDRLQDLGVTHLTVIPFGFQQTVDTPSIRMNTDARWYSESDAGIREIAQQLDARGMHLIIKPHIWVGEYSAEGQNRKDIGFDSPQEWEEWEAQYHRFIMHYAELARETDAAMLVVGTELARAVHEREHFWRALIDDVRKVYDGRLTYAGNWHGEYDTIPFWDALDYIGVQGYFPLADEEDPSVADLKQGWDEHVAELRNVAESVQRPVLFTEIGYRSVHYAAERPWAWPQRGQANEVDPDEALQARLYQAYFERFEDEPWLAGSIWWKWKPDGQGDRPLGFTPQDKLAETVLRSGFNRR